MLIGLGQGHSSEYRRRKLMNVENNKQGFGNRTEQCLGSLEGERKLVASLRIKEETRIAPLWEKEKGSGRYEKNLERI